MIEYHGNSGVEIDTQRFLGINTPIMGSIWGQGPYWTDNSNEALDIEMRKAYAEIFGPR